jgi:hypothetical protein
MQAPPEPMQLPLDECMWTTSQNGAATSALVWPVKPVNLTDQTGGLDRPTPRNTHQSDPVDDCDNQPKKIPYYRLNQSTLVIKW